MQSDRWPGSPAGSAWVTAGASVGVTVWLEGEHDLSTAPELAQVCERAIAAGGGGDVVVDLGGATFLDASTVAVLERVRVGLSHHARALVLRAPSPPARKVLQVCGLGPLVATPVVADYSKAP